LGSTVTVPVVFHAVGVKKEPVKAAEVTRREKEKCLLVINGFKFQFPKNSC